MFRENEGGEGDGESVRAVIGENHQIAQHRVFLLLHRSDQKKENRIISIRIY